VERTADDVSVMEDRAVVWVPLRLYVPGSMTFFGRDRLNPATLHAGMQGLCPGGCIEMSRDNGLTWSDAQAGVDCQMNHSLVVDRHHPGTMYAASMSSTGGGRVTCTGVYRTTDSGLTWNRADGDLRPVMPPNASFLPASFEPLALSATGVLYFTWSSFDSAQLWATVDGGISWQARSIPSGSRIRTLVADPLDGSTLWLLNASGLYRSNDGALTWQLWSPPPPFPQTSAAPRRSQFPGAVAIDPGHSEIVYVTDGFDVFLTADGGRTWMSIRESLPDVAILSMAIDSAGQVYVGTDGYGVYVRSISRRRVARH
jgi:Uncharacterized protein related to plant photosystem II stability/assembly factor